MYNQAENAGLIGISPAADKFFIPDRNEQVHHVSGLRMLDGIYANTNEGQRAELQRIGGSGHAMLNFMLMPGEIHQGETPGADAIHNFLRANNLEVSGNNVLDQNTFIGRTEAVRNGTFEQKRALMNEYATTILPMVKDKINDLMTGHYAKTLTDPNVVNRELEAAGLPDDQLISQNIAKNLSDTNKINRAAEAAGLAAAPPHIAINKKTNQRLQARNKAALRRRTIAG